MDKISMGRGVVFLVSLVLLISNPASGDVRATEGVLLSTVILSEKLLVIEPSKKTSEQSNSIGQSTFKSLADAILLYESIQNSGRWQPLAAGPLLRQGDRHKQVAQLKLQLQLLGDLPKQGVLGLASQYFDAELHEAVLRFQARHSAKVDGIVGPQTRALLNVPPWQRVDQLVLNLRRQQQLEIRDDVYLHINVPEYRLRFYQHGKTLLEMRTVVGKHTRQTPEFSATVQGVVINPDWNVPKSIAYQDILPKVREDPTFLKKRNLRVLSGWSVPHVEVPVAKVNYERMYQGNDYFRFWEPPGEGNTLGRMKFRLSSDNSIYLHDTQQKHLFDVEKRAFSSGCIRLENPRGLADVLIQVSNQWSPELLDPLFEHEDTVRLRLEKPVPVHVTYWTAWLDERGVLNFAEDLYQRDSADFAVILQGHRQLDVASNWLKTVQNGGP